MGSTRLATEPGAMTRIDFAPRDLESERLQERVRHLAEEKSYLQLILSMIEQINPTAGVHDMVGRMLRNIVEMIGGTNIKCWYWIEDGLYFTDFIGATRTSVGGIDDPLAQQVASQQRFVEIRAEVEDSLLQGEVIPGAWIWVFPLLVGDELVGIVKLENVHIISASLRNYLPIFFSHAALILSNEIRNHTRLKAQKERAESEERLRQLIKLAPVPLCYVTRDGVIQEFNDRFAQVFGYRHEEIPTLAQWWALAYPEPDYRRWVQETWEAAVAAAARSGADIRPIEYRVTCRNGDVRVMEISGVGVGEDVLASFIDLTQRRQADDAMRLAASVFANSQEGILITDAENHILDVNAAFCRISGYAREEVIGRDPKILRSGRHDAPFYAAMWRALKEEGRWRGEIWNRHKSGDLFAEMLAIDAVVDESGHVQHYVGAFTDITLIKSQQAELERIAHYDPLTGLPNRRVLADRLVQELARTRRYGRVLGICFLDLDGFKPVNDRHGHEAGDKLLIEIGRRLQEVSRAGDTVARIGGDEFVLLLCDLAQEQECYQALERVLLAVARPFEIASERVAVTASIGVTLFPRDDADADALLRHADLAMYRAKESGKGRFHLFDAAHDRQVRAHRETLQRLELAIARNEFVLLYQPMVNLSSGEVIGVEALIRWHHPVMGLLAPAEFLSLVSGMELEIALGEWVIDNALRQLEAWNAAGLKLPLSVNISPKQLLRPNFAKQLGKALARHPGVMANDLELEILESAAVDDVSHASHTLAACVAQGVRIALDDFGTGYSSLTYFRKLPVGALKIDQTFVHGILDDPENLSIVESVIALARAFNRPVVAEGVETLAHAAMLLHLGCPLAQGYAIARPMLAALLPDWIDHWRAEATWKTLARPTLPPADMQLRVAGRSQQKWGEQLAQFLLNPVGDISLALHSRQCPFGRWYYGSGLGHYGQFPEFGALEEVHQALHVLANELVRQLRAGQSAQARSHLPELQRLNGQLAAGLDRLIESVGSSADARRDSAPA